ncbi:hypothetical protein DER29_2645 [Micromonospora sp. M71_S20]|uniref:hypothetical protein n=1 Tax=Micromonospora TaxID=1873 RepID=UPI000EB14C0C|nr:hypothetical protein [Micromonospora sp. M71_S20]RLK24714.1 hypothetical protein DER29_2645 [Micromonospora sp. M71_S20]
MVYPAPNAEQLVELLSDIIRRHSGNPAVRDRVLIDIGGERVPIDFVDLWDITEECERRNCRCAYGQEDPPEDAPDEGVHFAVVIGGDFP